MRHVALSLCVLLALAIPASQASAAPDDEAASAQRAELRKQLAERRKLNIARFREYREKRIYPHNTYREGMLNVWSDVDGHLCAVATLMHRAGLDALVEATGRDENFVRVADLNSGPLIDWVLTSGFTQEEIVMIQQPSEADIEMMEREERLAKWRWKRKLQREDDRLEKNYIAIEKALKRRVMADAGLDLAVARLAARPDLVAALAKSSPTASR
jgi:aromatic ring-cleaving dioxygenase